MDFFNTSKKKLDIKNDNLEVKDFNKTTYENAKDAMKLFGRTLGLVYEKAADIAETGVDIINIRHYNEFKFYKGMDMVDKFRELHNSADTDIEMFEKRLQEEENEKRLKEQQMDKNITSPTSSLTKPVYLVFHGQTNEI